MPHGHSVLIVLLLLCQILGLILFLRGFFPLKKAIDGRATNENLPPEPSFEGKGDLLPPKFGRVVIMLIDALRADFVYSEQIRMPFTQELIRLNKSFRWIKFNSVYYNYQLSEIRWIINNNPLHPKISMHILRTVLYTFQQVLTRVTGLTIRASLVGDHSLYSWDLNVGFRGDIVRRIQMLVTLRGPRVDSIMLLVTIK